MLMHKRILHVALLVYLIALGFTVFTPKQYSFSNPHGFLYSVSSFFQPFHENTFGWTLGNILLLAPLGIILYLTSPQLSLMQISLICFATSALIELSQNLVDTRVPDIGTVAINGIGASLCTLLVDRWRRVRR
jgi:glycopeptide antibiotics resistance protein